jgi:hypothetical protein
VLLNAKWLTPLNNLNDYRCGKTTICKVNILGSWFMVHGMVWGFTTIIIYVDVIVIISIVPVFQI